VPTANTVEYDKLKQRIATLAHSLSLASAIGTTRGTTKRNVIKQLHHTDIRRSNGEESVVSNPHVDLRRKRTMRIRPEHTGAQRMMRARQRDINAAELELESWIAQADIDFDGEVTE
jgi:hypothetical protein